ncbi:metalloendopeptidase-like membrane protein [Mycobacterium tuberculosis]|nr:metalloendopeptidase-like membrane protein [Mycobacterium tuberculosis]
MAVFGVDYAWGRPGATALKRAGAKFACRYLSHDTTGKNLTRSEADGLSDAGIWVVVVWESTAKRPLAGRSAGAADARDAAAQARACGMPDDRPIYFAADWDAAASQQDEINAYLDGAASVIGRDRVGLYAGYGPMKRAFDAGKIAYGWQTYAWSGGRWDARAQLQQYSNDHTINGVGVDYDRAVKSDYGQWRIGVSPEGEDDMPSVEDIWEWDGIPSPRNASTHDSNPTWKPSSFLRENAERIRDLQVAVAANGAAINELSKALAALAADRGQEIDVDALVARITSAIESVTVRLDVADTGD